VEYTATTMTAGSQLPADHQAALAKVGRLALEKADFGELLHESAALVAATLEVEFCKILELLPDRRSLLLRAGVGWREGLVGQAVVPATSETHAGHTLDTRAPVIVEDLREDTRFQPSLLHEHGVTSGVGAPIPSGDPFGVLGVYTSARRIFAPHEVEFLESAAEILSHAVQRRRTEEAIRQSEERFRRTFEGSPIGMAIIGLDHRLVQANRVVCELLGCSEEESRQLSVEQVTHPDDRPETAALLGKLFRGEIPRFRLRKRILARSGRTVWVDVTATLVEDDRGNPLHAVSMVEDLSAQRRKEKDLRLARFTLDHAQEAIFWTAPDGRLSDVNGAAARMLGYTAEGLLSMNVWDIDENISIQGWPDNWKELKERSFLALESSFRARDGRTLPVELTVNYLEFNGQEYSCGFARDISKRRRAEAALEASENRYRQLFENSAAMVWMVDLSGRITTVNQTAERFSGYAREELAGKDIGGILPPDQAPIARSMIERKLKEDTTTTYDLEILAKDGRRRPMQITSRIIHENGKPVGIQGIGIDISEKRRVQEALRQSEEHFRSLIENTLDLVTVLDESGRVRYVSPSIERVLGYRPEDRIGQSILDLIHPDDAPAVKKTLAWGRQTPGAAATLEYRARHKSGSWRQLEGVGRNLLSNPAVAGIVVNSRDITERRLADEKIRVSEEWFRSSFEYTGVPTAITTIDGRFLRVNRALCRFFGRSEAEMRRLSWREVTHPEDTELSHDIRRRLLAGEMVSIEAEKRYLRNDGSVRWGYLILSLIHDSEGRPRRIAAQIVDITKRTEAEDALRQSEHRFRLAAESASDLIYEWDVSSGRLEWYGDVDAALGYRRGRFPRTFEAWKESLHPDDREGTLRVIDGILNGATDPFQLEYRMRTRKGGYRHWLDRGRRLLDEAGVTAKWIGACSDITRRKQIEEALRRSEAELRGSQKELRALAGRLLGDEEEEHRRLARELHDDFNQRLTAAVFRLAGLEEECPADIPVRLKKSLHLTRDQIADLSDDMRRLAHQLHPAAIELLGLPAALRQQCQEASRARRVQVRFSGRKLPESFPSEVALCLYRITQESLRNIAKHAAARKVSVTLYGVGRALRLSIKDDGRGFDRRQAEAKGGLGLISMRERVRLVGGALSIESRPGQGTHLVVDVPLPETGAG